MRQHYSRLRRRVHRTSQKVTRSIFKVDQEPDQIEERISGNPLLQPEVAYEWSYGIVYSPKWLKGMTLSADWWHIDLRSLISSLGAEFIIEADLPGLVFRTPPPPGTPPLPNGQPDRGTVTLVIDPNAQSFRRDL